MQRLLLLLLVLITSASAQTLQIPRGAPAIIDGNIAPGEWSDAGTLLMQLEDGREIPVLYKHDGANIYFAFQKLGSDKQAVFPELLFDPANQKGSGWQRGQLWLHASFKDCEGNGAYNVYRVDGKSNCSKEKPGWWSNNFPLDQAQTLEMKVSFAKLSLGPEQKRLGFALDLTNTRDLWVFWPQTAKLESPRTWGEVEIKD